MPACGTEDVQTHGADPSLKRPARRPVPDVMDGCAALIRGETNEDGLGRAR